MPVGLLAQPTQVDNIVVGAIQRRANKRVHTSADTQVVVLALALQLGYPGKQNPTSYNFV